jgi:hypothetical protein
MKIKYNENNLQSPVISCPNNSVPGIGTFSEPKVKNLGGADNSISFRFFYTCRYFNVEG